MMGAPFQYVVLHKQNRTGVYAVQAAHAASEAIRALPLRSDTIICVLVAETQQAMKDLRDTLLCNGVTHSVVVEDKPPFDGVITAIATTPGEKSDQEIFFRAFKILS